MGNVDYQTIIGTLQSSFSKEILNSVLSGRTYTEYAHDPVGFGEDMFGESYTRDVKRLMLSVRDNEITVAQSANATGKTHAAARVAMWFYKCFAECKVYTAAAPPLDNLETLLWGEIGALKAKRPDMFEVDEQKSLFMGKTPEYFLKGVTIPSSGTREERVSKFSGKHAPHMLFILDEGDAIPDEVYEGIETCMSGGHCRLLVMFNPKQELGEAYRLIRNNKANVVELSALNHPNVRTGKNLIPGAVSRKITVQRIHKWTRPIRHDEELSEDEEFTVPSFLQGVIEKDTKNVDLIPLVGGQKRKITSALFSYMVIGRYPAQGVNQLISKSWIFAARSRWDTYVTKMGENYPHGVKPVMGLDAATFGPDSNCVYFRAGGYVSRPEKWGKVDTIITGDRAANFFRKMGCTEAYIDANGVGTGVAPYMRRLGCNAHSIMVTNRPTQTTEIGDFRAIRDQLLWLVREWLRTDPGAMLPPEDKLLEELAAPTYEVMNGRIKVMSRDEIKDKLGRSPDELSALALTFAEATPEHQSMGGALPINVQPPIV